MYKLKLLGGVLLSGPDGPVSGPATQQRRLALLAFVGSAGDRGRSRDQLISLLWPETDPRDARQHLSHSIYALRRELGQESIRSAGEYVRLSPAHVSVDAVAFERGIQEAHRVAAAELYAGSFMDGFFIDGAPEFEHWVDSERRRLASLYAHTVEELARDAIEQEDHAAAAEWWGRLVAHDPYNSAAVVSLMEALAAAGDPANAIQYAQDHLTLLDREFGLGPPEQVVAKVEELQEAQKHGRSLLLARPQLTRSGTPMPVPSAARDRRPMRPALILGVVVVAAAAILWSATTSREPALEFIPNAIMVREVENLGGDSTLGGIGRYTAYRLEGGLAGIEVVRVVTADESGDVRQTIEEFESLAGLDLVREMARQTRAGLVVESSFLAQGDSLLLEARLIEPKEGTVLDGMRAVAAREDPGVGVQALADQVMVAVATRLKLGDQYAASYGRGQSYQAWQEVDAARELWAERGREREAFALLYRALAIDSTFDSALGLAVIWHMNFGEFARSDSLAKLLEDRVAVIPPRQRWQLAVNKAVLRRDRLAMVNAFQDWKDRLPNASRWLHLAMAQSLAQRPVACLESLENVDLEGSRYARSGWMWTLYAECHRSLGDYRASLERAREGRSLFPDKRDLVIAEALALAGLGRVEELNQLIQDQLFKPAPGETFEHDRVFSLLVDTGLELRAGGHRQTADEILSRAVDWYARRSYDESSSPADRWRLARALYASERWEEARDEFSGLSAQDLLGHGELVSHNIDVSLLGYRATLAARLGDEEEAARIDEELAHMSRPYLWGHATYWRSALAAVRGESELAADLLGEAMAEGLFAQQWGTEYPKWPFQIDPDFDSLRDYGPFQELIAPRG